MISMIENTLNFLIKNNEPMHNIFEMFVQLHDVNYDYYISILACYARVPVCFQQARFTIIVVIILTYLNMNTFTGHESRRLVFKNNIA